MGGLVYLGGDMDALLETMQRLIGLRVNRISEKCILPKRMSKQAAGLDIFACLDEDMIIKPLERCLVPTGFCMELPAGLEAQIRPRSGLAWKHGITVLNSPGTIDSDFRGQVKVMLINLGNESFTVKHGERIAQMIIAEYADLRVVEVDELSSTERGTGGFGSTGLK
jgi:dUTP pyrophosphatase